VDVDVDATHAHWTGCASWVVDEALHTHSLRITHLLFLPHSANELEAASFYSFLPMCHLVRWWLPHQLTRQLMFGSQIAEKLMIVESRVVMPQIGMYAQKSVGWKLVQLVQLVPNLNGSHILIPYPIALISWCLATPSDPQAVDINCPSGQAHTL